MNNKAILPYKKRNMTYLVKLVFAAFGVVNGWLITVMAQMSGCYKTVTP